MSGSPRVRSGPSAVSLAFYRRLDRLLWPKSYSGKIFLVAFLSTHIPLLALIGFLVVDRGAVSPVAVVLVAFVATGVGAVLALWSLHQLLRPLVLADHALNAYLDGDQIIPLPTSYQDTCGRLLRNIAITITSFEAQRQHLEAQAFQDALTGLPNRHGALARMQQSTERPGQEERPVCLALVDVDHFKAINDRYGHAAGDAVLVALGRELRGALREADWVARWGGEEFLVILEAPLPGAVVALDDLRARIAARPLLVDGQVIRTTISVGVALLAPAMPAAHCLRAADAALYRAKRSGRNRVLAADSDDRAGSASDSGLDGPDASPARSSG